MKGKAKALGLALIAALAVSAAMASAALAVTHEIELEAGNTTAILTGTTHVGKTDFAIGTILGPGHIKCVGHYAATVKNGAKGVTILPRYDECEAFENPATITVNHCDFLLEEAETNANGDAPVKTNCSGGSTIEFSIPALGCTLKFGEQTPGGGVHYTNVTTEGGRMEVTMHATLTGVTFTKTGSCGLITGTTTTTTDTVTFKAYKDNGTPTEPGTNATTHDYAPEEGAQIGVTANPGG